MDVRFADPWILLLLLALPAIAMFAELARRSGRAVSLGTVASTPMAPRTWRMRTEPLLTLARLAAIALLIVGLARPQRGEAITRAELEGIDIVLAYDVSSSMTQTFGAGLSRLEAAEEVLKRFVAKRQGDRVGLVAFRGYIVTLSPLTTDYNALSQAVEDAGRLRLEDGTAIGPAIGAALNVLEKSDSASRIVILLTDGTNNAEGLTPLGAARIAQELGIRVYTVGVVSPGLTDQSQSSLSVDETVLKEIANITGATHYRAEDPGALGDIYNTIEKLEKTQFEGSALTLYVDVAPWVLAAAAIALALEVILRATTFRRAA
jgi:Ca-activated chloride channel family protein